MKKGSKRCKGCGAFFIPEKAGQRVCDECRELIAVGNTKNILEFERLRHRYNTQHGESLTYGQFEGYIENIEMRIKS